MEDWTRLPDHLLDLISEKISSPGDYLQFGATCVSWNSAAKLNLNNKLPTLSSSPAPMLLVHSNRLRNSWRVYDAMRNKFLQSQQLLPSKGCLRFSGSSRGWLASVSSDYSVTLHKCSLTNIDHNNNHHNHKEIVSLPVLFPPRLEDFESESDIPPCEYHVHMVLLTADPLENPNECTVVVIFGIIQEMAFLRLGRDTCWTIIERYRWFWVDNVLYHNNKKFYGVDSAGHVLSFEINPNSGDPNIIAKELPFRLDSCIYKWYLVTSPRGELWCIGRDADWTDEHDETPVTNKFKLFRLENVDSDIDAKAIEIDSIGDVALFLGDNSSISVVASDHFGCKPNTIYFAHDISYAWSWSITQRISDFGLYHVKTKKFEFHYNMGSYALSLMSNRQPVWVIPSLVNL